MRLTVVGSSGSVPGPDSACSCYLVEQDGFRLLLDLGTGAVGPLQRYVAPADV
ncbi:MBL fold metallo-hydrolase, partial [Streptomyces griseoincarnatus]